VHKLSTDEQQTRSSAPRSTGDSQIISQAGFEQVDVADKPAWRRAERDLYESSIAADAAGDPAKAGINNFSFVTFDQLDRDVVVALRKDIEDTIQQDPIGSWRYSTYRLVSSSAEPSTA
jgi:hypothetical protein